MTPTGPAYFAHVPKCGGSSVEDYIAKRGVSIGLIDRKHHERPVHWSASSPQHMSADVVKHFFSKNFFTHKFAIVRDPIARFISAFEWQKAEGSIDEGVEILHFVHNFAWSDAEAHNRYDEHFRPQTYFIPPKTTLFRLEDGLEAVTRFVDGILQLDTPPPATPKSLKAKRPKPTLDGAARHMLHEVYAKDYKAIKAIGAENSSQVQHP